MGRASSALLRAAAADLIEAHSVKVHGSTPVHRPSLVLPELTDPVACDTEGSGLHTDDGARPSIIIVAWREWDDETLKARERDGENGGGRFRVRSYAFPFDQGPLNKPGVIARKYNSAQGDLFDLFANTESNNGDGANGSSSGDGGDRGVNLGLDEWDWLMAWLSRRRLVFHNAKHDLHQFRVGHREWGHGIDLSDQLYWDTMVGAKEIWPLEPVGLETLCRRLRIEAYGDGETGTGKAATGDAVKEWLSKRGIDKSRYDLVPWDIIGPYGCSDGELTIRALYAELDEVRRRSVGKSADESNHAYERRTGGFDEKWVHRAFHITRGLYRMETRGLPFNSTECIRAAGQLEAAKAAIAARLPFDPSKESEIKRYYFGKRSEGGLGLMPYSVTTKKQEPQLTEDVRRKMIRDDVPHAKDWDEYGRVQVALTMWYTAYPNLIGTDGRLRTSFKQTFVRSGRLSVERFQAQALPHDHRLEVGALQDIPTIRSLVQFPAGKTGWEVDLATAELRVAAKAAGCNRMIQMFLGGADLHGETAKELFGIDPASHEWFKYRQVAKRGNFSFIFGVGAQTFRDTVDKLLGISLTLDQAELIVRKWNGLYPEFRRTIYDVMNTVRRRLQAYGYGWVTLANGKRRWFQPYEDLHKAFNQYVQGSLAELSYDWMNWTEEHHPGVLLLTVHDSQVIEVDEELGSSVADAIAAAGGALGTKMFRVKMEADAKPWNVH